MTTERIREEISGKLTETQLEERTARGWRLVALEWERDVEAVQVQPAVAPVKGIMRQELPYGLRVAADCTHLEEDPREKAAMELMLQRIVEDCSLSQVAQELNKQGFTNRRGKPWTQTMVFNLLPRLIEVAPDIRIPEALTA